jgi:hypothetical protein
MNKKLILAALTSAAISSSAYASASTAPSGGEDVDKKVECKVVDKDGKGIIKAGRADCKTASHDCAFMNKANDAESWITATESVCKKLNNGEFDGIEKKILDKLDIKPAN